MQEHWFRDHTYNCCSAGIPETRLGGIVSSLFLRINLIHYAGNQERVGISHDDFGQCLLLGFVVALMTYPPRS